MSYFSRNRYAAGNISLILCLAVLFSLTFTALPQVAQAAVPVTKVQEAPSSPDQATITLQPTTETQFASVIEQILKHLADIGKENTVSQIAYQQVYKQTYEITTGTVYTIYDYTLYLLPATGYTTVGASTYRVYFAGLKDGKWDSNLYVEVPVPIPKPEGGEEGGGAGGGGGGAAAPSTTTADFGQVVVNTATGSVSVTIDPAKAQALLAKAGDTVTFEVAVPAGTEVRTAEVKLPSATLAAASQQGKAVAIKLPTLAVTIPPEAIPAGVLAGATNVTLNVQVLGEADSARYTATLPSAYRSASDIFELEIKADQAKVTFAKPVTVRLSCRVSGGDPNFLGVYRFNESTGAWGYVGGRFDKDSQAMTVQLRSFSKYAVFAYHKVFLDTINHWAKADIEVMAARHVAKGVSDTLFAPEEPVTRAQFAALLVRTLGLPEEPVTGVFADVPANSWYAGAVGAAYKAGLVKGYAGKFQPGARISREEMAAMVARALAYAGKPATVGDAEAVLARFSDKSTVAAWARAEVAAAVQSGIITGLPGGTFGPKADATRAQSVVMLKRLLVTTGEIIP